MKKVTAIVQARLTSSRLPNKVLEKISKYSIIELIFLRLKKAKQLTNIVFAIPDNVQNDPLFNYLTKELNANVFRGSEEDVLSRYKLCAEKYDSDFYVRITADCPFVLPELVDKLIDITLANPYSYVSNISPPTFADGFDVEVFSKELLLYMHNNFFDKKDREHVTYGYLKRKNQLTNNFNNYNFENKIKDYSKYRLTLDTMDDLKVIRKIADEYNHDLQFINESECILLYENINF